MGSGFFLNWLRLRIWVPLALALISTSAFSAITCYQYRFSAITSLSWQNTISQAVSDFQTYCNTSSQTMGNCVNNYGASVQACVASGAYYAYRCQNFTLTESTNSYGDPELHTYKITTDVYYNGTGSGYTFAYTVTAYATNAKQLNPNGCPCGQGGNTVNYGGDSSTIPSTLCDSSHCMWHSSGVGLILGNHWNSNFTANGGNATCSLSPPTNFSTLTSPTYQTTTGTTNISTDFTTATVDSVPINSSSLPNGCIQTSSGAQTCVTGTAPKPTGTAPNNGTPNQAATPSATISTNNTSTNVTTTYNVYNSTVVSNSSNSSASSDTGSGSSSSSGGGLGSSSSSASSTSSSETCTGDCSLVTANDGQAPTFGESLQSMSDTISSVPIIASVSNISASIPAGQCYAPTFNLFGHSITMNMHCTIYSSISSVLSAIFLAMWSFAGLRIIMSA
jgi:hypothetical protein